MQHIIDIVTLCIASAAGIIIVYGVILGLIELVKVEFCRLRDGGERTLDFDRIRFDIGRHLLLGLEFLIAADIIRTVVSRTTTLEELAILGGIVAIRTVLSFFLVREVARARPG